MKGTLSGEDEVEDDRKLFFSPDPLALILELPSCFLFLGFFDVLESSSERLLLMSRLEEPEAEGSLSSRRGMISKPADADDPPFVKFEFN